jgi:type III secretory pathway lipoprotein EscJ
MDSVPPETTSGGVFLLPVSRSKAVQIAEEISDAFPDDQYETVAVIMVRAEQRRNSGLPSGALLYEHNTVSGLLHLV